MGGKKIEYPSISSHEAFLTRYEYQGSATSNYLRLSPLDVPHLHVQQAESKTNGVIEFEAALIPVEAAGQMRCRMVRQKLQTKSIFVQRGFF